MKCPSFTSNPHEKHGGSFSNRQYVHFTFVMSIGVSTSVKITESAVTCLILLLDALSDITDTSKSSEKKL